MKHRTSELMDSLEGEFSLLKDLSISSSGVERCLIRFGDSGFISEQHFELDMCRELPELLEFAGLPPKATDNGRTIATLGFAEDPFSPEALPYFDLVLQGLERTVRSTPDLLVIKTASPLVLLALPLLKSISQRVVILFNLSPCSESERDEARLKDELETVRTLEAHGIMTVAEVRLKNYKGSIPRLVDEIAEAASFVLPAKRTMTRLRDTQDLQQRIFLHYLRMQAAEKCVDSLAFPYQNLKERKTCAYRQAS